MRRPAAERLHPGGDAERVGLGNRFAEQFDVARLRERRSGARIADSDQAAALAEEGVGPLRSGHGLAAGES